MNLPDSNTEILETLLGRGLLFLNHCTTGVGSPSATQDNTNVTPVCTCVSSLGRTKICGTTPESKTQHCEQDMLLMSVLQE